jgi:hypothetical protein
MDINDDGEYSREIQFRVILQTIRRKTGELRNTRLLATARPPRTC